MTHETVVAQSNIAVVYEARVGFLGRVGLAKGVTAVEVEASNIRFKHKKSCESFLLPVLVEVSRHEDANKGDESGDPYVRFTIFEGTARHFDVLLASHDEADIESMVRVIETVAPWVNTTRFWHWASNLRFGSGVVGMGWLRYRREGEPAFTDCEMDYRRLSSLRKVPDPGWHPDPSGRAVNRWWNGSQWTQWEARA